MSDPIVTPTEEPAVETPAAPQADAPITYPEDHPLVKTLAAQKELIKGLKEKASRLDEIEEANKTELQKALERAERAETAAATAEAARLKASIAARHGVPESLLTGSTEDQLEEAAQELLAFKGTTPTTPSSDGQGKQGEPLSPGVKQVTEAELATMSDDQIVAAKAEGRLNTILGIN